MTQAKAQLGKHLDHVIAKEKGELNNFEFYENEQFS